MFHTIYIHGKRVDGWFKGQTIHLSSTLWRALFFLSVGPEEDLKYEPTSSYTLSFVSLASHVTSWCARPPCVFPIHPFPSSLKAALVSLTLLVGTEVLLQVVLSRPSDWWLSTYILFLLTAFRAEACQHRWRNGLRSVGQHWWDFSRKAGPLILCAALE